MADVQTIQTEQASALTADPIVAAGAAGDYLAFKDASDKAERAPRFTTPIADPSPAKPAEQAVSTDAPPKPASEPAKPAKNADTRIQELLAERAQLRAELDAAKRPVPPVEMKPASEPAAAKTTDDPEPDPADTVKYADGQFDRAYLKDQARWEARQEIKAQQATAFERQQQERRDQAQHTRVATYAERITAHQQTEPGFLESLSPAVAGLKTIQAALAAKEPVTALNQLAEEIVDSALVVPILKHFSAHPEDLTRFGALKDARSVLREFGKLEKALEGPPAKATPTEPEPEPEPKRIPPPPRSVGHRVTEPADEIEHTGASGNYTAWKRLEDRREIAAMKARGR